MEKGLNRQIKQIFSVKDVDIRTYSPLTLAYIGGGIFDLVIRSLVVDGGNASANQLHHRTGQIGKAHHQGQTAEAIADELTEQEADVYRRGRNAKSHTMAKNATVADYRSATGFEALMGYLYLTDQTERLLVLVSTSRILQLREGMRCWRRFAPARQSINCFFWTDVWMVPSRQFIGKPKNTIL